MLLRWALALVLAAAGLRVECTVGGGRFEVLTCTPRRADEGEARHGPMCGGQRRAAAEQRAAHHAANCFWLSACCAMQ